MSKLDKMSIHALQSVINESIDRLHGGSVSGEEDLVTAETLWLSVEGHEEGLFFALEDEDGDVEFHIDRRELDSDDDDAAVEVFFDRQPLRRITVYKAKLNDRFTDFAIVLENENELVCVARPDETEDLAFLRDPEAIEQFLTETDARPRVIVDTAVCKAQAG